MSKTLVTGGAGFLGSHLCERLLAEGHEVVCLDNLDTGSLQNIEYIRTWSLTADVRILWRTCATVLSRKGAY